MRGSGAAGLAGIGAAQPFADGQLLRPLIDVPRSALADYGKRHSLSWIEDPANSDTAYDRNFLRHEVMPRLLERWPAAARSLAHSATLCAEAADIVHAQASDDYAGVRVGNGECLRLGDLCRLGEARARGVLRHWLRERDVPGMPASRLREAVDQLCHARAGAAVEIAWSGFALRRYRDQVWLTAVDAVEVAGEVGQPEVERRLGRA